MTGPIQAVGGPGPAPLRVWAVALMFAASVAGGCGFVPRKKLDECHDVTVTLRSENARLKDVALDLRSRNQDLTQRAVDDGRRIASQDEAIQRLEKSVLAYQSERDQLSTAFEAIKKQVRLGATAQPQPSASAATGLESFATAHAGWTFDAAADTLSVPVDRLFEPDSTRLRDTADADLAALAEILAQAVGTGRGVELVGHEGPIEVRQTALGGAGKPPSARFLATARAGRVREALARHHELDPGRLQVAAPPPPDESDQPARIELRLVSESGGLDVGTAGRE